uniref:Large ribosomal subunit protein uL3c n=1 Tax=Membranoptera platyphylla TaxID=1204437 RepID=A0A1I9KQN1_9FLOR|nr:ribosomal protein L3 [Membranoptera platyphylla]AMJ16931.1 ribosomal protein L3 [Membranoptera platyphylla]
MSSIGMLGRKVGMTQIFNDEGSAIPATILEVGPCTITNITNKKKDEQQNIQIGYQDINPYKLTKARIGNFNKFKIPCFKYLKEYKIPINKLKDINIGKLLTVQQFQIGHLINISGISIGKGFSGYQKRHNFTRGPMSHGSKNHRQPGSIGAGTTPGRVFPGKKMAGRMGGSKVTIKNLQILDINIKNHIIIVKGSVPGKNGNILYLYKK